MIADEQGTAALMHYAARSASGNDPNRVRPMFIGLRQGAGVDYIRALFVAAARTVFVDLTATVFRMALEPETSRVARLLAEMGMRTAGRALDMRLSMVHQ